MYAIMNKEMNAYSHGPTLDYYYASKEYEKLKKSIINPEHWLYGSKLVRMKRVKSGIEFKGRLSWRHWYWKPCLSWRFSKYFHWLCFMTWFTFDYANVPDKIIKDHLEEAKAGK